jgi:hypothetical protein
MENDWLQSARDLDAAHRNSVVDNVRRVRARLVNEIVWSRFEYEFGTDETASHAIGGIRQAPVMVEEGGVVVVMPSVGAIIFRDLVGKRAMLRPPALPRSLLGRGGSRGGPRGLPRGHPECES